MEIINVELIFNLGVILLSAASAILSLLIVMKTEKELRKVFECFFISFIVLFFASILGLNKYFKIIDVVQANWVLTISRFLALVCSASATLKMLRIVRRQIKCEKSG